MIQVNKPTTERQKTMKSLEELLRANNLKDPEDVLPVMTALFRSASPGGFIAFNLFIDLFMCTLFMFFLNARPKSVLTGK